MNQKNFNLFKVILVLFVFSLSMGCLKKSYIDRDINEFENVERISMTSNNLAGAGLLSSTTISLTPSRMKDLSTGTTSYHLVLNYYGQDWIFIDEGETLVFLIDGQRFGLSSDGSLGNRTVGSGGSVYEIAIYDTDMAFIGRIANAGEVKVQIQGQVFEERHFDKSNFEAFQSFIAECNK